MIKNGIQKFSKISFGFVGLAVVLVAVLLPLKEAFAANDYVPLTTIPGATVGCTPGANGDTSNCATVNPVSVVKNIYGVSIGVAALLAVAMIIWAGVEYVTTEAIEGKSNAKEKWEGAIWGLVLLLGAYIILRTINVSLVNIDLSNLTKPCGTGTTQSGVPCGNTVTTGTLDQINTVAAQNARTLQQTQSVVVAEQKVLADLQTKRSEIDKQLQNMGSDDPGMSDLVAQAAALDGQIASAKKSVNLAQANQSAQAITTQSVDAISSTISSALNHNDATGIATAQATLSSVLSLMDKNIQALKDNPDTPPDVLAAAIVRKEATNAMINKTINAANLLQGKSLTFTPGYQGAQSQQGMTNAINALNQLTWDVTSIAQIAATKDPSQQAVYEKDATAIVDAFKKSLAGTGCPNGIVVSGNVINCAK